MSAAGSKGSKSSKSRKAEAAERARILAAQRREQEARARRRRLTTITVGVVIAVLVIAGGVGFGIYRAQRSDTVVLPKGATATGVIVGPKSAKVTVGIYLDFQCPICKEFETAAGPTLAADMKAGTINIDYHPVAYLDPYSSGTKYSTRASAASGCAADAGVFEKFKDLLYANQPPENGHGLTNDQLVAYGKQAGATSDTFAQCVRDQKYAPWTASVTDAASKKGVNGTPTIYVNGQLVGTNGTVPSLQQVKDAISAAAKS